MSTRRAKRLGQLGFAGTRLLEAWLTVAWVDAVITCLPYRVWKSWLRPTASARPRHAPGEPERLVGLVDTCADHYIRPVSCLRRSIALGKLLTRRGLSAAIRIGVTHDGRDFRTHAWLEHGGRVLNDTADVAARYRPFDKP